MHDKQRKYLDSVPELSQACFESFILQEIRNQVFKSQKDLTEGVVHGKGKLLQLEDDAGKCTMRVGDSVAKLGFSTCSRNNICSYRLSRSDKYQESVHVGLVPTSTVN